MYIKVCGGPSVPPKLLASRLLNNLLLRIKFTWGGVSAGFEKQTPLTHNQTNVRFEPANVCSNKLKLFLMPGYSMFQIIDLSSHLRFYNQGWR